MNKKTLIAFVIIVLTGFAYLLFSSETSKKLSSKPAEEVSKKTEASPFGGHVHALAVNGETADLFLGARPVYQSRDGGLNWEPIPIPKLEPRANITSITIDPKNSQVMYATGHGIAVAKSTNGGKTWETQDDGLGGVSTEAFAIDAKDPNKLYAWVLGDGMYRSENGGVSWGRVDDGPKDQEIRSLASVNLPTGMGGIWLYAGTDTGALKSPDCFCGWDKLLNEGLPTGKRVYSISADNNNPGTVYAGLRDGVYKTADEGKTWRHLANLPEDAVVAVHPKDQNIVYAVGSDGKLFVSNDAGENWRSVTGKPVFQVDAEEIELGEIAVQGDYPADFTVTNTGNAPLEISGMYTSCMCTFAKVIIGNTKSPEFNMEMHNSLSAKRWKGIMKPGQSAIVRVIYKPYLMPVQGSVARNVKFNTNDPGNPVVELGVHATVK